MNLKNNSGYRLLYLGLIGLLAFVLLLLIIGNIVAFTGSTPLEDDRIYKLLAIDVGVLSALYFLFRLLQKWLGSTTPIQAQVVEPLELSPDEKHLARAIKILWFVAITGVVGSAYFYLEPRFKSYWPQTFWGIFFEAILLIFPWLLLWGLKKKNKFWGILLVVYAVGVNILLLLKSHGGMNILYLILSYFLIRGGVSLFKNK